MQTFSSRRYSPGSSISRHGLRYDRVPGGFEMYAMGENAGEACATQISGVTMIRNTAPPNLTPRFFLELAH